MRADQLRLSAYEIHILRSILRDWRQFHITSASHIPTNDLDHLEDRLARIDIDFAEARRRTGAHNDHPAPQSLGLGAPGDVYLARHPLATQDPH